MLFVHAITVLLPVDSEHNDHFSQCWHTPWLLSRKKSKKKRSVNTVAGIKPCWIWFHSREVTFMKLGFSTASPIKSKRTWGSPSFWPIWCDFSRSEVRIRLRKIFSGWWIHTSSTMPPVSWANKRKLNVKPSRGRMDLSSAESCTLLPEL